MALGRAKLAIDRGLSVWVLEAPDGFGDAQLHAHHAIQLTACHNGDLTIVGEKGAVSAPGIAVAADAPHRFEARGIITFLFVEPESAAGRAIDGWHQAAEWTLLVLVGLHVLAVLVHKFIYRDHVMERMLPG